MRGAKRARRDQCRAGAGAAGDAMEARRLKGFGEGHGRQDGGESPRQHRRARPRGAEQQEAVVSTPASRSPLHPRLKLVSGIMTTILPACDERR
jgi:hypothetical protein